MSEHYAVRNALLFAFLGLAAWYDFRFRRIPNRLSLAGLGASVLFLLVMGDGGDWESSGLGFAVGVFSMLLLYAGGGVGGGDVKLMAGIGLLAGYPDVIYLLFFGGLIALLLIAVKLVWKGAFWPMLLAGLLFWKKREKRPEDAEGGELRSVSLAFALALGLAWVRALEFV